MLSCHQGREVNTQPSMPPMTNASVSPGFPELGRKILIDWMPRKRKEHKRMSAACNCNAVTSTELNKDHSCTLPKSAWGYPDWGYPWVCVCEPRLLLLGSSELGALADSPKSLTQVTVLRIRLSLRSGQVGGHACTLASRFPRCWVLCGMEREGLPNIFTLLNSTFSQAACQFHSIGGNGLSFSTSQADWLGG